MVSRWSNERSRRGERVHDIIELRLRAGADAVRSDVPDETLSGRLPRPDCSSRAASGPPFLV